MVSNPEGAGSVEFVAQGDKVVGLGRYRAVAKGTGKTFGADFVLVLTFRDGKIAMFQEFTESAGVNAACARSAGALETGRGLRSPEKLSLD